MNCMYSVAKEYVQKVYYLRFICEMSLLFTALYGHEHGVLLVRILQLLLRHVLFHSNALSSGLPFVEYIASNRNIRSRDVSSPRPS